MTQTIDDALLDEAWLAAPAKRSRLRMVLAGVLAASLCFLGGALAQKHYGASPTGAAASGFPAGLPGGLAGGFPGGGAGDRPGGTRGGLGGTSDQSSATGASDGSAAVIGTVVEITGDTWVVKDLGGKRHTIEVGDDTAVIREARLRLADVKKGDTVNVTGTTTDGDVRADKVILR